MLNLRNFLSVADVMEELSLMGPEMEILNVRGCLYSYGLRIKINTEVYLEPAPLERIASFGGVVVRRRGLGHAGRP